MTFTLTIDCGDTPASFSESKEAEKERAMEVATLLHSAAQHISTFPFSRAGMRRGDKFTVNYEFQDGIEESV